MSMAVADVTSDVTDQAGNSWFGRLGRSWICEERARSRRFLAGRTSDVTIIGYPARDADSMPSPGGLNMDAALASWGWRLRYSFCALSPRGEVW
jgi:hypothetical protein